MFKIKIKKENGEVNLSLTLQTAKIKQRFSETICIFASAFRNIKGYLRFKFKLFLILLKVLGASPKKISLKEEGGETLLLLSKKVRSAQCSPTKLPARQSPSLQAMVGGRISRNIRITDKIKEIVISYWQNLAKNIAKIFKKPEKKIIKGTAIVSIIALILQLSFSLILSTKADENGLCSFAVDAVLVIDTTGSMDGGDRPSRCQWENLEWVENEFGGTYMCLYHEENSLTQAQCQTKDDGRPQCPYGPVYIPPVLKKIEGAKIAAKSFVDNLGINDQSALVSFNNTATSEKNLSNDHLSTKTAIDSLTSQPGTGTNIGDAILAASNELGSERANPQAAKVIILLTDGKANKPNGSGSGEDPVDVAYARQKAQEAGNLGYKIFTIGLGSGVNPAMLQNIANTTGGKYYYAENGNGLNGIYDQISQEICQFGSISGCKYRDANNNGQIDEGEGKLSGWEIVLSGVATSSQLTDEQGCYRFAGLLPGDYTVFEDENPDKMPFLKTYPPENSYNITLSQGQNLENVDFANADSSLCQIIDIPDQCVSEGQREHIFSYNFAYCGQAPVPQNVADETCNCQASEISRQCVADGQAEATYGYNFAFCGEHYTQIEEDGNCTCQTIETSRECITDNQAQVSYTYNFAYCGQDFTEAKEDLACSSEYQCSDWQNVGCQRNGIVEQKRICTDQYANSYEETRQISDESCNCLSQEINRTCTSDGYTNVTYSWNYDFCGQNFNQSEAGSTCACVYSDWQNGECVGEGLRKQTRSQISQFDYCTNLERNVNDSSCACQLTEVPGACVNSSQRQYTFSYNFEFCGQKEPELRSDSACGGSPEPEGPMCGNGILEEGEECDDGNTQDGDGCSSLCQIETGGGEEENECQPDETKSCKTGQLGICSNGIRICSQEGFWGQCSAFNTPVFEVCNNGLDEDCDGYVDSKDSDCQAVAPYQGGIAFTQSAGSVITPIGTSVTGLIGGKEEAYVIIITWLTDYPATSRVIYDTISHPTLGDPPNYGYAFSTPEQDQAPKVTSHAVRIDGSTPGATYFYRTISRASPEKIGEEKTFTTPEFTAGKTEEKIVSEEIPLQEEEISLEEIEGRLGEIEGQIKTIREKVITLRGGIPFETPAETFVKNPSELLIPEVLAEEKEESKTITEELPVQKESGNQGRFSAAIGGFSPNLTTKNILVIFGFLTLLLIGLFSLSKRYRKSK